MKKDKKNIEIMVERMLRDFQKKYNVNISGISVYNDITYYPGTGTFFITEVKINVEI